MARQRRLASGALRASRGAGNLAQCHILFATRIKQVLGPEHLRPFQRPNCLLERRKTGEKRVAATQAATQSTQISSLLYLRCKKYVALANPGCSRLSAARRDRVAMD